MDAAGLALGWQAPGADARPGAPVELALGYVDEHDIVLTGDLERVTGYAWGVRFDVHAEPGRLHRMRVGQSYRDQSPADIVSELAGRASVRTADLESSDALAVYHVDERRTAWRHALELARLIGAELTCEPDGALSMKAPGGGAGGALGAVAAVASDLLGGGGGYRYGGELIDVRVTAAVATPVPGVVPHGAASPSGSDKWHLLLNEPDGGAPSGPTLVPGAARTKGIADALQQGLEGAATRRTHVARVVVRGVPTVRVGDPITVGDWPHGGLPDFRVTAVEHRVDRRHGFASVVELEQAA
jgi:hypothetical protein